MKSRACAWQGKHNSCTCAGLQGWILACPGHLWVSDCCFPGTAAHTEAPTQALFPVHHQTLSLWGSWAYYDTILDANLIWGNQLISSTTCKTDWQGQCQENESQFPAHLSHTLPASTFCNPFFPTSVATIARNKLINKQLLFQTRPNFYYYFNFLQRICIGKFPA